MTNVNPLELAFTVNISKIDRRSKTGLKPFESRDYTPSVPVNKEDIVTLLKESFPEDKFIIEVVDTYVKRVNAMTGAEFYERYNTPYYCSPSSETYWCS